MALLTIPTGATFSACRNNIDTMLVELSEEKLDKESRFRGPNREQLEASLVSILTTLLKTDDIENIAPGSTFRQSRPAIRRMFIAAYAV